MLPGRRDKGIDGLGRGVEGADQPQDRRILTAPAVELCPVALEPGDDRRWQRDEDLVGLGRIGKAGTGHGRQAGGR